ncbi:hypothetical protein M011DRAFT_130882 [Sporormia fimetaria CBS 119925]|uniref:Uncharacterized protein n=1 Tax=Sporormia fimetaria CBS 119925 TaxID=1340428 RepID=A0A6A6V7F2_9PLEO|nr:hypothetical protein M011DRAFT_130882 [Sporormia fimetaria CBS 119925]
MGVPMYRPTPSVAAERERAPQDLTAHARSPIRRHAPNYRRARPTSLRSDAARTSTRTSHTAVSLRGLRPATDADTRAYAGSRHSRARLAQLLRDARQSELRAARQERDPSPADRRDSNERIDSMHGDGPSFDPRAGEPNWAVAELIAAEFIQQHETPSDVLADSQESSVRNTQAFLDEMGSSSQYTSSFTSEAGTRRRRSSGPDTADMPPLRRVRRRRSIVHDVPRDSAHDSGEVDGLGDRDRSISPVDDQWGPFLSTVRPDPVAPSADSSFTSAAASASFTNSSLPGSRAGSSNSNSASSSSTHLTWPHDAPGDWFCATDGESESEDELLLRARARRDRRTRPHLQRETSFSVPADESYLFEVPPLPTWRGETYVRSLNSRRSSQVDARDAPADDSSDEWDPELRYARNVLQRLSRRNVPDDFWASVGLTRSMVADDAEPQRRASLDSEDTARPPRRRDEEPTGEHAIRNMSWPTIREMFETRSRSPVSRVAPRALPNMTHSREQIEQLSEQVDQLEQDLADAPPHPTSVQALRHMRRLREQVGHMREEVESMRGEDEWRES